MSDSRESTTPADADGWRGATLRAGVAFALLSGWMVLLFLGVTFAGFVHFLFLGALALFPWRALGASASPASDARPEPPPPRTDDSSPAEPAP